MPELTLILNVDTNVVHILDSGTAYYTCCGRHLVNREVYTADLEAAKGNHELSIGQPGNLLRGISGHTPCFSCAYSDKGLAVLTQAWETVRRLESQPELGKLSPNPSDLFPVTIMLPRDEITAILQGEDIESLEFDYGLFEDVVKPAVKEQYDLTTTIIPKEKQ